MSGGDRRKMITCSHGMVMGSNSLLFASVRVHSGFRKMKLCTGFLSPSTGRPLPPHPQLGCLKDWEQIHDCIHKTPTPHTHTHTHTHSVSLSLSSRQKPNSLFLWNAPNYSLTCNLLWKVKQFWVCPKELDVMTLLYCRCAQTTHIGLCFAFLLFSFIFIFFRWPTLSFV
jgi:hypothetical protein